MVNFVGPQNVSQPNCLTTADQETTLMRCPVDF